MLENASADLNSTDGPWVVKNQKRRMTRTSLAWEMLLTFKATNSPAKTEALGDMGSVFTA